MSDKKIITIIILIFILIFTLSIYIIIVEEKKWDKYSNEHNCVKNGYVSNDISPVITQGVGTNNDGIFVGYSIKERKDIFICDNNEIIIR